MPVLSMALLLQPTAASSSSDRHFELNKADPLPQIGLFLSRKKVEILQREDFLPNNQFHAASTASARLACAALIPC
jgi:hypothetical protein